MSAMEARRLLGWVALVAGGVLLLVGALWGHAGYYESQAPVLLLLVLGGGALAVIGGLMLRKPKQDVGPVSWRDRGHDD